VTAPACDPDLLEQTVAATRTAAAIALDGFKRADLRIDAKGDGTPVTQFDRAVERSLREHVAAHHPGDAVLGEEEGVDTGTTGRRWVIDPIDGTSPFSRGIVTWATLVALEDEHGPVLGVVACPWVGEVVWAGRGLGCSWDGSPARASDRTDLRGAVLSTSGLEWWAELLALLRS
jgi:histidinol-phosphatase